MRKQWLISFALALACLAQAQWQPAGNRLKTRWASEVDTEHVWPEYPRPQMERSEWYNLNGLWEYAILPRGQGEPDGFQGTILVPFAVESSLSGVAKTVGADRELWYKRTFTVPSGWKNKKILLHFGAVDWEADVFVNDILVGSHRGGYTPFSFDIAPYLNGKKQQKLVVRVWDPTERGYQPRGKQTSRPEGIWYTSVTGIWQTVWIEPVAEAYIASVKTIPDIDTGTLSVTVGTDGAAAGCVARVRLIDNGQPVAEAKGVPGAPLRLAAGKPELWSPDNPRLYDLEVVLSAGGRELDRVKSYTAFRKISTRRDAHGIMRLQLNNTDLFQFGPLDQGWWPDGLYTAPNDEALLYDIVKTKAWGFNMIRKHVKVEPARWYYHCDREGMLVWQDMPSGDMGNVWEPRNYGGGTDRQRTPESAAAFYREWQDIMDFLMSSPCVVVWVPFNEAWGQFDTEKAAARTRAYDPSRLVNPASGGNHRACGDMLDLHHYPHPEMFLFDPQRVNVLGEYGGIGLPLEGHLWLENRNWGYIQFKSSAEVTAEYVKYADRLKMLIEKGFSAAVYTQTTDVEVEVNGIMTYDREIVKMDEATIRKANREVTGSLPE